MRNVAFICAGVVIVVGAVVGSILVVNGRSSGGDRAGSSPTRIVSSSTTPASPSTSPTRAVDPFTLASAGLRRLVDQHRPTTTHPIVELTSCPFTPGAALASDGLAAAGVSSGGSLPDTTDVRNWNDSGDHGAAVTCRFSGPRTFRTAAYSHALKVARAPISGYQGPFAADGGRLYRSVDKTSCAAYWVPPQSDYVLSVQFIAPQPIGGAACGAALRVVQPRMFAALVRLGRTT